MADDLDFGEEEHTFQKLKLDGDDAEVQGLKDQIAKEPNNASLHAKLGKVLIEHDDFDAGVAALHKAIELEPQNPVYHTQYAHFLAESNELQEALASLNKALELAPNDADVQYELGRVNQLKGNKGKAVEHFKLATEKDSKHTRAWGELAANLLNETDAKMKEKNQEDALAIYKKVIELDPTAYSAYTSAGTILQNRNKEADTKEAAALFAKAVSLDPKDGLARARLVQCYDALSMSKEREEASQAFQKAFSSGKLSEAYKKLGRYCCAQLEVGDNFVMGYEHFDVKEANHVRVAFFVYKKGEVTDDKLLYRVSLTTANDGFVLESVHPKERRTYAQYKDAPDYQSVKAEALKIIRGELAATATAAI